MIDTESLIINAVSEPLNNSDNKELLFQQLEAELKNSETKGVGLAAVQIGILKRAAIIRTDSSTLNLWNPKIIDTNGALVSPESCLSFPGVNRSVRRSEEVTLENGDGRKYVFYEFDALVVQHEVDHMNGITILNKNHAAMKVGRNDPCPCGARTPQGGIVKFKKCHLGKEMELQQKLIAEGR